MLEFLLCRHVVRLLRRLSLPFFRGVVQDLGRAFPLLLLALPTDWAQVKRLHLSLQFLGLNWVVGPSAGHVRMSVWVVLVKAGLLNLSRSILQNICLHLDVPLVIKSLLV